MIEIVNGKIYIDKSETTDPELIGLALIDFAESVKNYKVKVIFKDERIFSQPIKKCKN
jgi:hypothetical protein